MAFQYCICGNPHGKCCNAYLLITLKDFKGEPIGDKPVQNTIQLLYNPDMPFPQNNDTEYKKQQYIKKSRKEPEVSFLIIPMIEDVHIGGNFDFAVRAQSPNYTPASADFIMDFFREYIIDPACVSGSFPDEFS